MYKEKDEKNIYRVGMCDALAIALYDLCGGRLAVWTLWHVDPFDDDALMPEPVHAVVVPGTSQVTVDSPWVDVDGLHTDSGYGDPCGWPSLHGRPAKVTLELVTREELLNTFTMEGVSDDQIELARKDAISFGLYDLLRGFNEVSQTSSPGMCI